MKIQKWTFKNRKQVLNHPRLKLVEDEVTLPDNKTAHYLRELPNCKSSVALIVVNDNKELLVQDEYNYPPLMKSFYNSREEL